MTSHNADVNAASQEVQESISLSSFWQISDKRGLAKLKDVTRLTSEARQLQIADQTNSLKSKDSKTSQNELHCDVWAPCADDVGGKATEVRQGTPDQPGGDREDPGPPRLSRCPPLPRIAVEIGVFRKL